MNDQVIYVGDPHIQPHNIHEGVKIVELVLETQARIGASTLVIGGDLFHTHAVLRIEVIKFWQWAFKQFSNAGFVFIYGQVGNHDQPGDKQKESKMSALDVIHKKEGDGIIIVDKPQADTYGRAFLPYYSSHSEFVAQAKKLNKETGAKILYCHQTFDGSKYDNGFYAPNGIDQNQLPEFDYIISGHIHTTQTIGRVFYPGTPKWDTLSDANEDKGIWFGNHLGFEFVSISSKIEPIKSLTIKEGDSIDLRGLSSRTTIELVGASSWIKDTSKSLKGLCRIVARPTDTKTRRRNVNNTKKSIWQHLENFDTHLDKQVLRSYLETICQ